MTRLLFAVLLLIASATADAAPPDLRAQRMRDVLAALQAKSEPAAVFAPSFRAGISQARLAGLMRDLEARYGKLLAADDFRAATATTGRFTLRFEHASATAMFSIEPAAPHRVTSLLIGAPVPIGDSATVIAADFAALPGRSGFAVVRLGDASSSPLAGAHADEQFPIGSAFKLWVLDALADDIAAGRHRWDEVVRLGPRSLPSGVTQDWPPDAALTVETLATLMISMSDNTATDTLIRLIGRDRVGECVRATGHSDPSRMLPLLTTAESFALKLSPPAEREAYARADDASQERMLAEMDPAKMLKGADIAVLGSPTANDSIEWFASPNDIARVFDSLRRRSDPRVLQILGVAPNLPQDLRDRFAYIGYKGGSEPGVIDLSWLVRKPSGEWLVVSASWNDPAAAVDDKRFAALAQRLLRLAAGKD